VEVKPTLQELAQIDHLIATTPSPTLDMLKEWARQAIGKGNYIRKKHAKLAAASINEKDNRYMEIKLECNQKGITFVDSSTKIEAEGYIAPLRTVRDVLESYVISADNIVSVCRMHMYGQNQENVENKLEI
jgi:hypothetical protein